MAKSIPISDSFDLGRIFTGRRQRRDPAISPLKPIFGLDTETWKGDVFLIADNERYLDDISAKSVIDFLFHKKYQNAWNFFFRLQYDAEVILKLLGHDILDSYKNTNSLVFPYNDYKLTYVPDKILRITKGHHSVSFYDIAQYYHGSLAESYEANIASLPDSYKQMKLKRSELSPSFYRHNTNRIRNYCKFDCKLTKELSEHWIKQFHNAFEIYCKRWISSGYLAEKTLINNGIEFPKFNFIPYDVQKFAWSIVAHGGRFEITKRGFVGQANLYDINSAYPYAITKIPNLTKGKWKKLKSVHEKAELGFFRIIADIPDGKHIAPFPFKKGIRVFFPTGKFETIVTLHELHACENCEFYKILDSYQFIPESNEYPYKNFIENLYQKRLELKRNHDPLQLPIKVILNSIYGKTGEKSVRMGNLFNPVIFTSITGMIRAKLYDFVISNNLENCAIAFATDSILTKKKLDFNGDTLGEFSFENEASDCYIIQNGYNYMNGQWKNRGITTMNGKKLEHVDTYVKNGKLFLKLQEKRNTRLRMGILCNKISDIGYIKPTIRWIDPNADRKRFWLSSIKSIEDRTMNESMPISLNYFEKNAI